MTDILHQVRRIQSLSLALQQRLAEREAENAVLQQRIHILEEQLSEIPTHSVKNAKELKESIETYLKDIDICLSKLNDPTQSGSK